ncbi:MAG TPA: hypothetical protein VGA36_10625 [Nitriliruptorales bacterium]
MPWSERNGTVTRAFDEWRLTDRDIRAYLKFGLRVTEQAYNDIWERAAQEPAWDDSPELVDVFHDGIDGVWPNDFNWMFLSGVLKDAVTAYEIYMEKAFEGVLRWHGLTMTHLTDKRSLPWNKLCDHYRDGLDIHLAEHDGIAEVRDLRHILTHKRGELRTDQDRARFGTDGDGWIGLEVDLDAGAVPRHLDTLAASVRIVDPPVWEGSCGRAPSDQLLRYLGRYQEPDGT